jgi:beta-galactosidase
MRAWPDAVVALGGDYNPEQWPREVWTEDVELMRRAGVTFATVGVFSWSWLEPEPGRYEFGWLDDVLDLLHGAGVAVDLATGTASPPPWFSHKYPDTLPVRSDGTTLWPGSRQAWCPSSTVFTEHAVALAEQMARRYHDHPALAMWHVSNEYACHNLPCYCDRCAAAFRRWLTDRYSDLEGLNDAWGTAFWSQRYTAWEQVLPPRDTPTFHNPTQSLDYWRFGSDTLLGQYVAERDVLHELSPGVPVTTNFMTLDHFRLLDYARWAPEVDVLSTDHYVVHEQVHGVPDARYDMQGELSFAADLTRGLAGGKPWVLMEHSTSAVNWQPVNPAKPAGGMTRDSLVHVARGADALGFFQWRQSRAGAEKYHSALVPHAGPDTKVFREVSELGQVCERLGELVGSRVVAPVALLWDYASAWAATLPARPSTAVDPGQVAHDLHAALRGAGITCDIVPPGAPLEGYGVVLVPTLYLCSDATAAAVEQAARAGAQVLVTYYSGVVDENDHVRLGGYPGAFRDLLGVRVEEFFPLPVGSQVRLDDGSTGELWSELLQVTGAEVVAGYDDGPLRGGPALTRRAVGEGAAWYASTRLDAVAVRRLVDRLCADAGVSAPVPTDDRVEVVTRAAEDGRRWTFLVNHGDDDVEVRLDGHDLVADAPVSGGWSLAAGAVAVVRVA